MSSSIRGLATLPALASGVVVAVSAGGVEHAEARSAAQTADRRRRQPARASSARPQAAPLPVPLFALQPQVGPPV